MTTYSAIADSEIDVDSPITESVMTRLRDNPIAMTEGSTGAPKNQTASYQAGSVDNAAIGASAVARAELKSTTASSSRSGSGVATLTGSNYSWWTASSTTTMISGNTYGASWGGSSHAAGTLEVAFPSSGTFYWRERYIQSSPPFNLGNGDIPAFIFLALDSQSEIRGYSVATTPHWAYNGPTDITAEQVDRVTGRKYRHIEMIGNSGLTITQAKNENPALLMEYLRGRQELKRELVEITHDIKNADMALFPHAWGLDPEDETVKDNTLILLNPFNPITQRFHDIIESADADEVADIIRAGHLVFNNQPLDLESPPGVQVIDFNFKNTA